MKRFFEESRAARRATAPLGRGAEVRIEFADEPGTPYRFATEESPATVVPGAARDPDFTLEMPPAAVEEITGLSGDSLGEFAVAFFKCILTDDPARKVRLKLHSGLLKLTRRGYLKTMALGGPTVILFMAKKGLKGPLALKRAISKLMKGT